MTRPYAWTLLEELLLLIGILAYSSHLPGLKSCHCLSHCLLYQPKFHEDLCYKFVTTKTESQIRTKIRRLSYQRESRLLDLCLQRGILTHADISWIIFLAVQNIFPAAQHLELLFSFHDNRKSFAANTLAGWKV